MSGYELSPAPGQLRVLRALDKLHRAYGMPATVRELCAELGLSSENGVKQHLDALERKGFITRRPRRSRSALLTREGRRWVAHYRSPESKPQPQENP